MEKQPVFSFNRRLLVNQLLFLGLILSSPVALFSQKYFSGRNEFGLVVGVSNYYGDLAQGQNIKHFHPAGGIYQKYNMNSYFSWRNQLTYMTISGTTEGSKGYEFQNLNFQTDIYEYSSMLNFDFHSFGTNINNRNQTPYALIGLSAFMFDPTRLDNEDVHLRNINTEMRKRNYSRLQMSVPLGLGYKVRSSHRKHKGAWIFGVEAVWRKTFTDNLDDVDDVYPDYVTIRDNQGQGSAQYSQAQLLNGGAPLYKGTFRGDTHLKDWYYFYGFNLSYRFTPFICR